MTGVELLLARAQLWQNTAAQHVSLQAQLQPLAGLAARWRRLELQAWHNLLDDARTRHAAGVSCWTELYLCGGYWVMSCWMEPELRRVSRVGGRAWPAEAAV